MNVPTPDLAVNRFHADPGNAPMVHLHEGEKMPMIRQYMNIAKRWRLVIAACFLGFVMLGLIVTLLMTPKYTAASTIEISRESDRVTNFQGVEREASIADQEFYQTQYGLLSSRTLSENVARELRLIDSPEFFAMFDTFSDDPALEMVNGHYSAATRSRRHQIAGEILLDNLGVSPARLSRLVEIRFTSPDANFSAKVANAWAQQFIETNLSRKSEATAYGREVLQRQLAEYKARLDESQRQLVAYASREQIINLPAQGTGSSSVGDRSIVSDDLSALNTALNVAVADRIAAEARFRQAGSTGASTEVLRNSAINNLRERRAELMADYNRLLVQFQPDYPTVVQVKAQIDQLDQSIVREESRVLSSYQSEYRQALQRESELRSRVSGLKDDYLSLRRRSIQYNIFQQEVDTNRALYDGLLQRFKEIGVAAGVGVNNIAIVDPALAPRKPSSPRLLLNLLASAALGLLIGALIALGLEQLDDAIEDPADFRRRIGLALLGTVPQLKDEDPLTALGDRKSELFDAYLSVQTNLSFATEAGLPKSIAVTSTRPAEGKSTTALALATTLTRSGRSVILIDGDMRSPSVHLWANADRDRGLSNFLSGDDNLEGSTFDIQDLGVTAMSSGPIPPNAAELLSGRRLSALVRRLEKAYDHVIIDCPPVLGLADAPLIASQVDGVAYCIEAHGIKSSLVKASLARLNVSDIRIFGCILTKFEASKAHHGNGYEYGYSYGSETPRPDAA